MGERPSLGVRVWFMLLLAAITWGLVILMGVSAWLGWG